MVLGRLGMAVDGGVGGMGDWDGVRLWGGGDVAQVRARPAAGADPCTAVVSGGRAMPHSAAEIASPEVVAARDYWQRP